MLPNEGRAWRLYRPSALITASYPPSPHLPGTLSSPKPTILLSGSLGNSRGGTLYHHPTTSGKPCSLPSTLEFHPYP